MFTGIIQNTGIFNRTGSRVQVESHMDLSDVHAGDSIAVNGVCLTTLKSQDLNFDLGPETLAATTLGQLKAGSSVHLEKAMAGHIIFKTSSEILKLCIPKGSITIDGVSLTINQISHETFSVCLVPHTLDQTNLKNLQPGDLVNLENDLIGKYVASLATRQAGV